MKFKFSSKKNILEFENCALPDPFKLVTGRIEEEDGSTYSSIIAVMSVLNFLTINSDITDLSDHKSLNGYSYFKQSLLGKTSYMQ